MGPSNLKLVEGPTAVAATYTAQVSGSSGNTITYPKPALLVASITNGKLIARALNDPGHCSGQHSDPLAL